MQPRPVRLRKTQAPSSTRVRVCRPPGNSRSVVPLARVATSGRAGTPVKRSSSSACAFDPRDVRSPSTSTPYWQHESWQYVHCMQSHEVGADEDGGVDAVDDGRAPAARVRAAQRANHARERTIAAVTTVDRARDRAGAYAERFSHGVVAAPVAGVERVDLRADALRRPAPAGARVPRRVPRPSPCSSTRCSGRAASCRSTQFLACEQAQPRRRGVLARADALLARRVRRRRCTSLC